MARYEKTFAGLVPPEDRLAASLETRGLWHRASLRWLKLLLREPDERRAEAMVQRRAFCLAQAKRPRPTARESVLTENDRIHLDARAKALGCGPVSKYWIDYRRG